MPIDRTRQFSLPDAQDLSKDQEEALALPLEGQHIIVGGPGTGKSIIALLRARLLAKDKKNYCLLVYNRTLNTSNQQIFGSEYHLKSDTWISWFSREYRQHFHEDVPKLQQAGGGRFLPIDWEAVRTPEPSPYKNFFLLIDEGQDMPPAFYKTLIDWGIENFYVLIDQNQRLEPEQNSSRSEIKTILCIQRPLVLRSNYRNTLPIALLAQYFYPGDPASPRPELPAQAPSAQTPVLMQYKDLQNIASRILRFSDRYPKKLIGIITPTNNIRARILASLSAAQPPLDNGRPPVQTYVSGMGNKLDFSQGGIMVLNAQSCKGLEFDTAILADIDQHWTRNDEYLLKSRLYVMASRAREQLILLRTGAPDPVIEKLLPPKDSGLLLRQMS